MLAHFMLFSEADIEYRFLMATTALIKEETMKPLIESQKRSVKNTSSRFHKVTLDVVTSKSRRNKTIKL